VRNLAYSATQADLAALFGEHGQLEEVHLVLDRCVWCVGVSGWWLGGQGACTR
jgi:hypothetical protein